MDRLRYRFEPSRYQPAKEPGICLTDLIASQTQPFGRDTLIQTQVFLVRFSFRYQNKSKHGMMPYTVYVRAPEHLQPFFLRFFRQQLPMPVSADFFEAPHVRPCPPQQ